MKSKRLTVIASVRQSPILNEYLQFLSRSRSRLPRSMREFAEAEIIVPDGPFARKPFRVYRQPVAGLWLDLIDSGHWRRYVLTAPSQSGKTLAGFVIPILYHLFELNETVICGLPSLDMASDKWLQDLLPAIEAGRYRDYLPRHGPGSRGGKVEGIRFRHGPTLKFMSGGGSDKKRAGFTSRVLVITETDGMDEAGGKSRESDKITQMEARLRAFGRRARSYLECTVSVETGRTWQEYTHGTESKIAVKCRHCLAYVVPEREHLIGWQDAETVIEARECAAYACPDCGGFWTEADRADMNASAIVIHRGQRADKKGKVKGPAPQVETLGFRYHAFHNQLLTAGDIAADEWHAARNPDEDNAEKAMRQFVWALPHIPTIETDHQLEFETLIHRTNPLGRGIAPAETVLITAGIDVGRHLLHWVAIAWTKDGTGYVIDYGRIEVPSADMPEEKALLLSLREWRESAVAGFAKQGSTKLMPVEESWVDSGYQVEDAVYVFTKESGPGFRPTKGYGLNQRTGRYHAPTQKTSEVKYIGEGWHVSRLKAKGVDLVHVDGDHWKSWLHGRLDCPKHSPGAMTLFRADPRDHLSFAKHLTAEEQQQEFVRNKGIKIVWRAKRKQNHWLDGAYLGSAAANYRGVKLGEMIVPQVAVPLPDTRINLTGPDGRSFFATNR